MKTRQKPSIFGGRRRLIRWARAQHNAELICAIRSAIADHIQPAHIGRTRIVAALPAHVLSEVRVYRRELAARARAQRKVSDLCATANGTPYHTTQGWWVTPMLTERGTVGLVSTTQGVALDTGVRLSASERLAVALPMGPLAGRNEAARSHRASTPVGWRQLACDTRGGTSRPAAETMPDARVVATGLMTCYGHTGASDASYEQRCGWPREHVSPFCAQ